MFATERFITSNDAIYSAYRFAANAHAMQDQRRKYTNEPYIVHPTAVAFTVFQFGGSNNMVSAALLHDVLEDTSYTESMLRDLFDADVVDMVVDLTDVSTLEDGNRAVRKRIDREHTASASPEAKFIKLADLHDNTKSIVEHDKNFARVYLKEKEALMKVLYVEDEMIAELWHFVSKQLEKEKVNIANKR